MPNEDDRRVEEAPATPSGIGWGYVAAIVIGVIVAVAIICAIATIGGRQQYKPFVTSSPTGPT